MSDSTERFAKRKQLTGHIALPAPQAPQPVPTVEDEARALVVSLDAEQSAARYQRRLAEAKQTAIAAIAVPFGLGSVAAGFDRKGGDVGTIHNVRKGIWASDEEKAKYDQRPEYDSDAYHKHPDYIETNRRHAADKAAGTLVDAHTGEVLKPSDPHNLDHFIAAKPLSDDPGIALAEVSGPDIANLRDNLGATHESINKSKGAKRPTEHAADLAASAESRRDRIQDLSSKPELTDKERKELRKLVALEKADPDLMRENEEHAQEAIDRKLNETYYGGKKFWQSTGMAAAKGAATSGVQRAIGELVTEFFAASFDEIEHWQRARPAEGQRLVDLQLRLHRIAARVAARKQAALAAFGSGAVAGLLSSLVTTAINIFATTQKNVVRMIREGLSSLSRTIALLFDPNITGKEALHAGIHITAATGAIVGGIALEEYLHLQLMAAVPFLEPIAGVITAAVVGALTALTVVVVAALIDWIDPLGVVADQQQKQLLQELDARMAACLRECENYLLLEGPVPV